MRRIFISYSRKDGDFVRRLAGDLSEAGHEVWWDVSNIRGGDDWVRVIPEAIDACEIVIVVISPQSILSEWVRREYTQALHRHKRIIPLMRVNATIPFSLNTLNYIDFTVEEKYTTSFLALLRAIQSGADPPVLPVTSPRKPWGNYAAAIMLGIFLLLALVTFVLLQHPLFPATPAGDQKPFLTNTSDPRPLFSATVRPSPALLPTASPGLTLPALSTGTPAFQRLTFCVNSRSVNSINVRSGPGSMYPRIGDPLPVGSCLDFRGQDEEGTWLLIAPAQSEPALRQYEGGWIYRELLGLGSDGPIDLPAITLTPTPTSTKTGTPTP